MKRFLAACSVLILMSLAFAQEQKSSIEFFSDEVPRYEGFAVGAFLTNQYALGDYAEFAVCNIGGGLGVEYTLPLNLPKNLDLGISAHFDFDHVIPKSNSTLKSDEELRFAAGGWLRLPVAISGLDVALEPEFILGFSMFNTKGQNGSTAGGVYPGVIFGLAPSVRIMPPVMKNFEIEASPLFTVVPEQKHATVMFGLRLGLVYHIQSFINDKKAEREEAKKAELAEQQRLERERQEEEARRLREEEEAKRRAIAEAADEEARRAAEEELRKAEEARKLAEAEAARIAEEERKKAEEEAARLAEEEARRAEIAAWPAPQATLKIFGGENFTPDGDGQNDKIKFTFDTKYLEEDPESWILAINDPQGNPFRTFKGLGVLPDSINWDGLSDKGENVFSRNTYTAKLSVTPSRHDRVRSGAKVAEMSVEIHTGLLLQVIIPEHEWKIVVNTIYFAGGGATFQGLSDEQMTANTETLDEVAEQIIGHPGAIVIVEGYANNISGTVKEDTEELIPLSQDRADFIVQELVSRGIDASILTATGRGGANPIAARKDKANWWKNRRIEFIIRK